MCGKESELAQGCAGSGAVPCKQRPSARGRQRESETMSECVWHGDRQRVREHGKCWRFYDWTLINCARHSHHTDGRIWDALIRKDVEC